MSHTCAPINTVLSNWPDTHLSFDMPSHTAASALIKLYSLNGAPWSWTTWQEITKIEHGLFPLNDSKLPPRWTRTNATDVQSYFHAYKLMPTEDKKLSFATDSKGGAAYPGRKFWNTWVGDHWNAWGIHNAVVEELRESDVHPLNILIRENDSISSWPAADFYIPLILDGLAMRLFGEDAFPNGSTLLSTELRRSLQIIAQRSWNTIRIQVGMLRNRPLEIEAAALAAFNGQSHKISLLPFLTTTTSQILKTAS